MYTYIHMYSGTVWRSRSQHDRPALGLDFLLRKRNTPNLPINIVPTNIARVKLSGKSPTGLGIPPL